MQAAKVEATPFRRVGTSTESAGPTVVLAEAELGNIEVGPGVIHEFSLAFTPQLSGDVYIRITVAVQGTRQRYDANRSFAVEVEAP